MMNRPAAVLLVSMLAGSCLAQVTPPSPSTPAGPTLPPAKSPDAQPAKGDPQKQIKPAEAPRAGEIDLRARFRAKDERRLKIENSAVTEISGGLDIDALLDPGNKPKRKPGEEPKDESKVSQEYVLVFKTRSVDEAGAATVDVTFESIKVKLDNSLGTDEFDSTKPAPKNPKKSPQDDDPLARLAGIGTLEATFRPLVGDKLTLTLDREGNITKVDGGEKFAALFQSVSPGAPGGGGGSAQPLIGRIVSPSMGRPSARVGDKWTTVDKLDLAPTGALELRSDYTLRAATGGHATIEMKGALKPDSQGQNGLIAIKSAEHSGVVDWDREDGFVRSMTMVQKMEAEVNLSTGKTTARSVQNSKITRLK